MIDFHLHTHLSADGHAGLCDMAAAERVRGVKVICVTDHCDRGHYIKDFDKYPDRTQGFAELAQARAMFPEMTICYGMELGDFPSYRAEMVAEIHARQVDYALLSLHMVDQIDCYDKEFFKGRTREDAYRRYVRAILDSALNFPDYDGFAHIGYVGRNAPYLPEAERPLCYRDAPDELDTLLKTLILRGKTLELNGKTFLENGQYLPHTSILKRYRELGGERVTVGSDAHTTAEAGRCTPACLDLLRTLGFRYVCYYRARKPYFLTI